MKYKVHEDECNCCTGKLIKEFDTLAEAKEFIANYSGPERLYYRCNADPEEISALQDTIQRVRELHKPGVSAPFAGVLCAECEELYPCMTVQALDGEQSDNPTD